MNKEECREQIQEDVIAYMQPLLDREYEFTSDNVDDLCQIVVDNFKKLETEDDLIITQGDKKLKEMLED
tara:strand:- start:1412 stop:1618 length:207 start_codon:yes stop_codon:yes gene_type:complete